MDNPIIDCKGSPFGRQLLVFLMKQKWWRNYPVASKSPDDMLELSEVVDL